MDIDELNNMFQTYYRRYPPPSPSWQSTSTPNSLSYYHTQYYNPTYNPTYSYSYQTTRQSQSIPHHDIALSDINQKALSFHRSYYNDLQQNRDYYHTTTVCNDDLCEQDDSAFQPNNAGDYYNDDIIDFTTNEPTGFDFGDENDTASAAANGGDDPSLIIIINSNKGSKGKLHQQWYDNCVSKVSAFERVRGTRWTNSREQTKFIISIVKPFKRSGAIFAKRLRNGKLQECDARAATYQLMYSLHYRSTERGKQCMRQSRKRYNNSEHGKQARKCYRSSEQGKRINKRYMKKSRAQKSAARLAVLETLSDEPPFKEAAESIAEAERIINDNHHIFNERLDSGRRSFYIFYTGRDAHEESTMFLSSRNSYRNDPVTNDRIAIKGNPVLRWKETSKYYKQRQLEGAPDPGIITGDQFRNILGARMKVLYTSKLQYNARMVEDSLQYKYLHRLKLGQRLFRDIDRRNKFERPKEDKLHQVGIIYTDKVKEFINSGDIVVTPNKRKEDVDAGDWDK